MPSREAIVLAWVALAGLPAAAETRGEVRPEIELYFNQGERTRILFRGVLDQGTSSQFSRGSFLFAVALALRPLLRRGLRKDNNVFRRRYLNFRFGYEYNPSFVRGSGPLENRGIAELTGRYRLPGGFVLVDRNRGDFRFVQGQAYSSRYRNRLWVEHDVKIRGVVFAPYVFDEIYFDTRYNAWTTNQYAAGAQLPVRRNVVVEPYFLRHDNSRSTPHLTNALGCKVSLFF
jgi:hypothetical protein